MDITTIFVGVVGLIFAAYLWIKKRYSYWADRKIDFVEPTLPYGNLRVNGKKEHPGMALAKYYQEKKGSGPFAGIYFFISPVVLATDIEFIRNVLIKDFQYFQDRGTFYNEKDDPLSAHLFNLDAVKWKNLRAKLTPTFTSKNMKFMYPTIVDVADEFQKTLNNMLDNKEDVLELRDLLGRFTTDVIGTCAFGIECNSLKDPHAKFRQMGKKVFEVPKASTLARTLSQSFQGLAKFIKLRVHHKDVTDFFMGVVKETVAYREANNIQRNDFMNLLIQLKNQGHLNGEAKNNVANLTINEIAAQAYVFFLAGFETSSTTLTFALYELAVNKDIQTKARQHIETILEKHQGKLTYEALFEMTYIDHIINESLRKYPPASNLVRQVTKDYPVPGMNLTLNKGMRVMIPVYGIHHDPEFYAEPDKFQPERFEPDQVKQRPSCTFLPFGDGPRNCIGLRFGMLQARVGLVMLLKHFEFLPSSRTTIPLQLSKKHLVLAPIDGLWLKVKSVNQN